MTDHETMQPSLVGEAGQRELDKLPAKVQARVAEAAKQAARAFCSGVGEYSVPRALAGSLNGGEQLAAVCTELACVVALRAVSDAFPKSTILEAFFSDRLECFQKLEARGSGYSGAPSSIDEPIPLRNGRFNEKPFDVGSLRAAIAIEHGRKLGKALVDLLKTLPSLAAGGAYNQFYLAVATVAATSKGRAASQSLPRIPSAERNAFIMRVQSIRDRDIGPLSYVALNPLFETWFWSFGRLGTGGAERNQCSPSNDIAARALDLASGGPRKESAAVIIADYMAPAFAAAAASSKSAARVLAALTGAGGEPPLADVSAGAPPRPDSPSERIANVVAAIFVQGCEDMAARGGDLAKQAPLLLNVCRDPHLADRIRRLLAEIGKIDKQRIKQWKKTAERLYPTESCATCETTMSAPVIEFEDDDEEGDDIVEHMFASTDAKKSDKQAGAFASMFADTLGAYCIPRANAADAQSASSRSVAASAPAVYALATELVGLVALQYATSHKLSAQLDAFYGARLAQFYQQDRQGQVGRDRSDQFEYFRNLRHEVPFDKPRFKKGKVPSIVDGKTARAHGERLGKALAALLQSSDFKKVQSTLYGDVVAEVAKLVAVHDDATYALPKPSGPLASRESQVAAALLDTLFETYVAYFARSAAPPAREAVKDKWSRDHASTEMLARYLQLMVGSRAGGSNTTDADSLKRLAKRIAASKNKAVLAVTGELIGGSMNLAPDEPLPTPTAGFPSVPYSTAIEDLVFEGYVLACETLDGDMRASKFDAKKRVNVVRYVRGGLIAATPFDARIDQLEKLLRNPGMANTQCCYDDYDEFERAGYEIAQCIFEETAKKSKSEKLEKKAKHERHKEHERAKKDYEHAKREMKRTKDHHPWDELEHMGETSRREMKRTADPCLDTRGAKDEEGTRTVVDMQTTLTRSGVSVAGIRALARLGIDSFAQLRDYWVARYAAGKSPYDDLLQNGATKDDADEIMRLGFSYNPEMMNATAWRAMEKTRALVVGLMAATGTLKGRYEERRFEDLLDQNAITENTREVLRGREISTVRDLVATVKDSDSDPDEFLYAMVGDRWDAIKLAQIYRQATDPARYGQLPTSARPEDEREDFPI